MKIIGEVHSIDTSNFNEFLNSSQLIVDNKHLRCEYHSKRENENCLWPGLLTLITVIQTWLQKQNVEMKNINELISIKGETLSNFDPFNHRYLI